MTSARATEAVRRRAWRWWALAAVLLLIAGGSFEAGLRGHRTVLEGSEESSAARPPAATDNRGNGRRAVSTAVRSTPVALRIPAIGVEVPVSALGLNPDRTVQVPTDFREPGWFRLGPSPGQMGSAVILGHVDSHSGPAVFFRLRYLNAGDRVDVTLADGTIAHFEVSAVRMYPKRQFPARQVYGSHGYSALQLVTCGGVFDTRTHSYQSNVVAYTSLVSITTARAPGMTTPKN
ncbi:class F sortase [Frankia sp. AvcI1]|uniref:class F sortase n=1 Tax=Frankia sp. AvcI1 TaxID=573496 RepID=UPI002119B422|nr:class F sortase [Frankia sp. AvcI1]